MRLLAVLMIPGLFFTEGCALLPHQGKTSNPTPPPNVTTTTLGAKPETKRGFLDVLIHPFAGRHRIPQKKAQPLRQVGTVRTLSNDGSYVIVESEPGTMVTAGAELLITATGSQPARLKVAEIQTPYFVADIVAGHPEPGDRVQQ